MNKRTLISMLAIFVSIFSFAQRVTISPIPQNITWGQKAFDRAGTTFHIEATADIDTFAIYAISAAVDTAATGIPVIMALPTDARVAHVLSKIPRTAQGYYLSVRADSIIIAGRDNDGVFYAVQSLLPILSQNEVQQVTLIDYPSCPLRGVIEGFYGNPWSTANRKSQFDFYGANKMNIYVYGPKDDAYHRGKWRTPYPDKEGKVIKDLAEYARKNHVIFVWAIHPGGDITWSDADFQALITKFENVYSLGVRAFSVFFDDIGGMGAQADKQAELLNYVWKNFVEKHTDVTHLSMCPTQYNKAYASGNYLTTLGSQLNSNIHVMWTGNSVVDMINASDVTWFTDRLQRKPFIWLNYPVNDYCIGHMLMGKTYGNDLGNTFGTTLSAFCSNPMEYAEASKVSLYSIADYSWNMKNYDAQSSWERAIPYIMPTCAGAFMTFCENNVDLGYTVHGLRRENESPTFAAAVTQYEKSNPVSWCTKGTDIDLDAVATMNLQMDRLVIASDSLLADKIYHPVMIEEITPWVQKMRYMGQRGQLMMQMWNHIQQEETEEFLLKYDSIKIIQQLEDAIRSRDFSGTIKMANPVVGEQVIQPFLKKQLNLLVNAYKARFSGGWEHFDPVPLDNGVYYLKYNGRYLTNATPGATRTGDHPVFKDDIDDYNPQKCEWNIAIDPQTNRYKITSVQDGRYLNEVGIFWKSTTTNPYDPNWNTYILRCCNGKFAIQNAGSAGNKYWTADSLRIFEGTANSHVRISDFIFELIPVGGTNDHPTIESGKVLNIVASDGTALTDVSSGKGAIKFQKITPARKSLQKFVFTAMSNGRWKLTKTTSNGAYINEHGVFGTNAFLANWNTYVLTECGGLWNIQNAEDAGTGFWSITSDATLTTGVVSEGASYLFRFVDPNATGIEDIDANSNANSNLSNPSNTYKYLENGRLIILKGSHKYTVTGQSLNP